MARVSRVASGLRDRAVRTPDRTAVRDATGTVTFAELDALVGTLARRLREVGGAGRGDARAIPLLVGRDRWSVVALHAAFRAGIPCAPIDARLPERAIADHFVRLGHPTTAVVAEPGAAAVLPPGTHVVALPARVDDPIDPVSVDLDVPAVVVFTSGSTGRPKGVVLDWSTFEEHPAHYLTTRSSDAAGPRIGILAPLHWVVGLRRVLAISGGASVSIRAEAPVDPEALLSWLDAEQVTQFGVGPALAARLDGVWPPARRLERVDLIILGGDAATAAHVEALRRIGGPHVEIRYGYGATETAGFTVLKRSFAHDEVVPAGPLPLGRADLGRIRLEPADDDGGLCELVAVGAVARGYLDEPDLTEARFGIDADGTRWWRTGDLVRADRNGTLWYAGRVDDAVKINGQLVAPAESETVLRALSGVRQVAVVPRVGAQRTGLVAHLEIDPAAALTPEAVRSFCADRLAPHVVPGVLVRHDCLPSTVTGKTDRSALAASPVHPWRVGAPTAPPTDLHRWLLAEVRRVLELDDVTVDDDLRAIGLDSLAAVDLCAAIADAGFAEVDPAQVYAARSVSGLARTLWPSEPRGDAVVWHASGSRIPVVAVPGGGGTAVRFQFLVEAFGEEQPVVVVEPRGMHRRGRPDRTVSDLATHVLTAAGPHLAPDRPLAIVGYSASGPVAYEAAARLRDAGRRVHLVLLDTAPTLAGLWESHDAAPTVRTASGVQRIGAAARSLRYRLGHPFAVVGRWRLERFPGHSRFDVARYRAFQRIMVRAGRAYVPAPATFGATLVQVAGIQDLVGTCRRSIADLRVRPVEGDHASMLEPPHVAAVATAVQEAVAAALGEPG